MKIKKKWNFMIDQGGTFTDIIAVCPSNKVITKKVLSFKNDKKYNSLIHGINLIKNNSKKYSGYPIGTVKIGTTIGTNALLERKGFNVLLLVTKGFKDNFIIGTQQRNHIFKRHHIRKKDIYNAVLEVDERISKSGKVLRILDKNKTNRLLKNFFNKGINSIAINLINGFKHTKHEREILYLAKKIGFKYISCSHQVSPTINFTSRGYTTLVDAYLNPIINKYINSLESNLKADNIYYMQSNGLLESKTNFNGRNSIFSGPAGGLTAGIDLSKKNKEKKIIGFDMGGTSADIWHYNGELEKRIEVKISDILIKTPSLKIDSIAAGGSSITKYENGRFVVGPESAGSFPGPACYRNEGPLTLTDCNLVLGRISKEEFPKLFGKSKNLEISTNASIKKLRVILKKVKKDFTDYSNIYQVAEAFINVSLENMSNAIKKITIQKGHDIRDYSLLSFGSASGQYCCKLANKISLKKIIFSPYSSVLSAYGIGVASNGTSYQCSIEKLLNEKNIFFSIKKIKKIFSRKKFKKTTFTFRIKYHNCNTLISIPLEKNKIKNIKKNFYNKHKKLFGFNYPTKKVYIDSIEADVFYDLKKIRASNKEIFLKNTYKTKKSNIYYKGKWINVKKINKNYFTEDNNFLIGPAIFCDYNTTFFIEKSWIIKKLSTGDFLIHKQEKTTNKKYFSKSNKSNPEMLEVFNSLFYSVAEQMGIVLKNTAQSINVKERMDFSCALFSSKGDLIANAPHIPIHLGAMSDTVKYLISKHSKSFKKGISLLHNNPYSGGTHLPDLTVITPLLNKHKNAVSYFLANRAHHSDIGGITPGSMPAFSKKILDEGIIFDGLPILEKERINEDLILNELKKGPFPSRDPYQNLYDIRAQIASNQKGIIELRRIINKYGENTVKRYVNYIQNNCRKIISTVIKKIPPSKFRTQMDNGATINIKINFNSKDKKLYINFFNSSEQLKNNFNAPKSVTKSVIIYFLRTLIKEDIPLNEGFLKDVKLIIPEDSFLNPVYPSPVVAGNVETSQTLIDTLNAALKVQAACYGTMSNITFGNKSFGYYETICGGEGASYGNNGTDAVHCHMTNTSITDPEILEWYYPVRLNEFSIRKKSGGLGKWTGGNGVIRQIEFLKNLDLTILSNRRLVKPFGINTSNKAKSGKNYIVKANKKLIKLDHVSQIKVNKGDKLFIKTPGGGGFG